MRALPRYARVRASRPSACRAGNSTPRRRLRTDAPTARLPRPWPDVRRWRRLRARGAQRPAGPGWRVRRRGARAARRAGAGSRRLGHRGRVTRRAARDAEPTVVPPGCGRSTDAPPDDCHAHDRRVVGPVDRDGGVRVISAVLGVCGGRAHGQRSDERDERLKSAGHVDPSSGQRRRVVGAAGFVMVVAAWFVTVGGGVVGAGRGGIRRRRRRCRRHRRGRGRRGRRRRVRRGCRRRGLGRRRRRRGGRRRGRGRRGVRRSRRRGKRGRRAFRRGWLRSG